MPKPEDTNQSAYSEKFNARLDQWKAELDKLEAKARESGADAKIELNENVTKAKERWETAKNKAKEMESASGNAWEELKVGAENAFESLKDAVQKAQSHLR